MKRGWSGSIFALAVLGALWGGGVPLPLAGQEVEVRQECRCVDEDGSEIENCTCFRMPDMDNLLAPMSVDSRPRIGISIDVDQGARRDAEGALVTDVLEDGPADQAGIREGDVITSIDGRSLLAPLGDDREGDFDLDRSVPVQRLLAIARELEPGQVVEIEYLRDGDSLVASVEAEDLSPRMRGFAFVAPDWDSDEFRGRLRELTEGFRYRFDEDGPRMRELREHMRDRARVQVRVPNGDELAIVGEIAPPGIGARMWGPGALELATLNPSLGRYFGAEEGVLVVDVEEDSALGLQGGDVIVRIGERAVDSPRQVRRILASYDEDEEITFHVVRDGRETRVTGYVSD